MSDCLDQLTRTVEALAQEVSALGTCECDLDESLPCELHSVTLAQYEGSSARSADQLVSVELDELVAIACHGVDATPCADIADCAAAVLDDDSLSVWRDYGAALAQLDPFTSWIDDRELADSARELAESLESDLPEDVRTLHDDGFTLYRITGGPLLEGDESDDPIGAWIDSNALEVYATAQVTPDSLDLRTVVIVTGIGGPHVEVTFDLCSSYCRATVEGFWGSDHITRTVEASDPLASWINGYAETLEEVTR